MERDMKMVTFAAFILAGLIPCFSNFFMDVLVNYGVCMARLSPNAMLTFATFSHFYEAFIGVMPSLCIFCCLFKMSKTVGDDPVGCVRFSVQNRECYIEQALPGMVEGWRYKWLHMSYGSDRYRLHFTHELPDPISEY